MLKRSKAALGAISKGVNFFTKQDRDWKITVTRTNFSMFIYQIVLPYISIYTMALGATGTQLGIVNSIGMAVAGIIGPLTGWMMDKTGVKKIYLIGIGITMVSYLIYGLAHSWSIIIVAMIAYYLGNFTSIQGCSVICANCLQSNERATGMSICETFGMGILGIIAPMIGAWLVTVFGGVNITGVRPLFFICLGASALLFLFILSQLSNRKWGSLGARRTNFWKDYARVFKEGHHLRRWLIINSITGLPLLVVIPYVQPFAHDFKGANQFILGAMVTAMSVMPFILGVPIGRLSDRIGRKKILYALAPLVWAAYMMLIFAPNPVFLIISGAFLGFFNVSGIISEAMSREMVPMEQMGRWIGIMTFFRMCIAAIIVYLAGIIWDKIGPQYIFVLIVALDLVRIALLRGVPETLHLNKQHNPGTA
jgi:MFS family permease